MALVLRQSESAATGGGLAGDAGERPRRGRRVVVIAAGVLVGLSGLAAAPCWEPGWYGSHEGVAPLERVVAVAHEIRGGDPYPRWTTAPSHGHGSPFLSFYSPGLYLAAGHLHALGLSAARALAVLVTAALAAGALGTFLWVRRWAGDPAGLLAAVLYLLAPYHLVDLYVRGALAELAALGIVPFLFLGIDLSVERAGARGAVLTAASTAGLILTHNLSALIVAPFGAAYAVARAVRGGEVRWPLLRVLGAAAAGAGVSAFYWLPVALEARFLGQLEAVRSGPFSTAVHAVSPSQWLDGSWGFGVSVAGPDDGMSFQLGYAVLAAAVLGAASAAIRRRNGQLATTTAALAAAALFLSTQGASVLYESVPGLAYVQFPWRLLGTASLFLAALGGLATGAADDPRARWGVAVVLSGLACAFAIPQVSVGSRISPADAAAVESAPATRALGTMTAANEYQPVWAGIGGPPVLEEWKALVEGARGSVSGVERSGGRFQVTASGAGRLAVVFPQYYFPGWYSEIDGERGAAEPGPHGFVRVHVPPGTHRVAIAFGTTRPRVIGWLIAALSGLGLAVVAVVAARRDRARGEGRAG